MRNFWQKYKEYVVIFLYLVFIWVLFNFVVKPLILNIVDNADSIQKITLNHEIRKKRLEELPKLKEQFDFVQKEEGNINVLISREQAVALIEELEKLSAATQNEILMQIEEKEPEKSNKNIENKKEKTLIENLPNDKYLRIKIRVSGKFGNVINFIQKLENLEYFSDVISVQISNKDLGSSVQSFQISQPYSSTTNPFASGGSGGQEEKNENQEIKIKAILDAVFYLKN